MGSGEVDGFTTLKANAVRGVVGLDELLLNSFNFSHWIFIDVIKHYRPDEFPALCRKYLQEWRQRMMSIPTIRIVGEELVVTQTTPPPMHE